MCSKIIVMFVKKKTDWDWCVFLCVCEREIYCPCCKQAGGDERLEGKSIAPLSTLPDITLSDLGKDTLGLREGGGECTVKCK